MWTKKAFIIAAFFTMVACANDNGANEDAQREIDNKNTQPIHYETNQEKKERLHVRDQTIGEKGGYPQTHQDKANDANNKNGYTDVFTNEEAQMIAETLQNKREIVQAQVASTDDRIIVGVILQAHAKQKDSAQQIKKEVKKLVPNTDKQIIVYTDDIHWDRMKNLDARLKAKNNGDKIEQYINEFINNNN